MDFNTLIKIISELSDIDVTNNMPTVKPVPLKTKGKMNWFKKHLKLLAIRRWRLVEDYILPLGEDYGLIVPKPFVFDFASVPRIFWPLLSPVGILLVGSVFHDFGYRYNGLLIVTPDRGVVFLKLSRLEIDELFKLITVKVNAMKLVPEVAEKVVNVFGHFPWVENRNEHLNVFKDYHWFDIRSI